MNIIGLTQFKESVTQAILDEISRLGGTVISPTVSLCQHCHYHVPAYRYHLDGKVYICKHCATHKFSHHLIENDYSFYSSLYKTRNHWNFDNAIILEVTDRCNIECPHCYHLPDNQMKDRPREEIINQIKTYPDSIDTIVLGGAEPTLRKDFIELVREVSNLGHGVVILSNGIKFADEEFSRSIMEAGLSDIYVNVGLNHPSYINNKTIRTKQERGIENIRKYMKVGYIGYSLVSNEELHDVLVEITTSGWDPIHWRIRYGSEIGRNATPDPIFLSNLFKDVEDWAKKNNKSFNRVDADNNIYHQVVELDGHPIRLIHWCDETNIDMEELRSGPWTDFVPKDGITNFLHQIIRRDTWKNKSEMLPDSALERHNIDKQYLTTPVFTYKQNK